MVGLGARREPNILNSCGIWWKMTSKFIFTSRLAPSLAHGLIQPYLPVHSPSRDEARAIHQDAVEVSFAILWPWEESYGGIRIKKSSYLLIDLQ